ncbi:MAG TPA: uracil-DNA glycosylase family protein [Pyrinomonadaceae bacterium]|nr:uracil-DNA glycosylase family protein [Pyrinomonadaceae bacterium]
MPEFLMADEKSRAELLSLAEEVGEHLSYLRELGVDFLESAGTIEADTATRQFEVKSASSVTATDARRSAALQRNAEAEARAEKKPPAGAPTTDAPRATNATPTPPATTSKERDREPPPDVLYQTAWTEKAEMPTKRKPVRKPDPVPPPPQETLFGEITPKDELSLPREGETYEDIRNDIGECMRCPLCCEGRSKIVHSEGNPKARLMFVGEAPGADEDASGRPFVGRAGQLLNKIIEAIGMKREDVFIGNVNRCRPAGNRTPTAAEAATCKPFLLREIALLRPQVIVVLGNTAMKNLLETKEGITKLRGTFMDYKGIKVMPTFHPAYLLRDPSKKRETWEDMKKVREYLNKSKADK